jgi:hypothetical protein
VLRRLLVVALALVSAWLAACLVLFVWPPDLSGAPQHADAAIVLSGEHNRLGPALDLARRGVVPVVAISSVARTPKWKEGRRLCAAGRYGAAQVVCFLAVPYSTRGEARAVARLAKERSWRSVVVSTSTFHVTRAHMLFRRCFRGGLSFVGSPSPWWRLPADWASETGKLLVQLTAERGC